MEIFAIIFGSIFISNIVLSQFLGICPFLGVSKDVKLSLIHISPSTGSSGT